MADDKGQQTGSGTTADGTGGATQNAGITFSPEQQAHIDALVSERLKRAQGKWADEAKAASDKGTAEAEAKKLAEEKRFSELADKAAKERDAAIAERDAERARVKHLHMREGFREAASAMKLKWATEKASADAFALVATEVAALDVTEDGKVKGIDEVLKGLQSTRPYLFSKPEPAGNINAGEGRGNGAPADNKARNEDLRRRFRIG